MPSLIAAVFFALALGLAIAYVLRGAKHPPSWPKSIVKTGSVAALVPIGVLLGAPWLVVLGLALGAFGDLLLSRPTETAFLAGMGAFAAGHLAYVAAFWALGAGQPPLIALVVFGLLALSTEAWLAPNTGALRWPVRGYVIVITLMGIVAFALPGGYKMLKLGVLFFVLSDLLLSLDLFVLPDGSRRRSIAQRLLWTFYWSGQALILASALPMAPV